MRRNAHTSINHDSPETKETRESSVSNNLLKVVAHGTVRRTPVAELDPIMRRIASSVDDQTHEDKANKCEDFDRREPELEFSEYPDAKKIYQED